jgi:selenoprotein W-related protein
MHVKSTLIAGSGGIFDVKLDGALIYSKAETGRFPEAGEVTAILQAQA